MTSERTIEEVIAFSDEELVQYMLANRKPGGEYTLRVQDWNKLTKDERDALAKRLRDAQVKADETAISQPLDLAQVKKRLLNIPSPRDASPPNEETDMSPFDETEVVKVMETYSYNLLLESGGRPAYPISLIDDVCRHEEKYQAVFAPWRRFPSPEPWVDHFFWQAQTWEHFCKWRCEKRGVYDKDAACALYVERRKYANKLSGWRDPLGIKPDPLRFIRTFEKEELRRRAKQRDLLEDHSDGDFPRHVEAMKQCLESHGFTERFQMHEDLAQQDTMTTWIEYLGYEYLWYDKTVRLVESLERRCDELWKKVVDANVLRPSETRENILSDATSLREMRAKAFAEDELEAARSNATEVLATRHELSPQERRRRLWDAHMRLDDAQDRVRICELRHELLRGFSRGAQICRETKKHQLERRGLLLDWVLEQISIIKADTQGPIPSDSGDQKGKATVRDCGVDDSNEVGSTRENVKRKRSDTDESSEEEAAMRSSKRDKQQHQQMDSEAQAHTHTSAGQPAKSRRWKLHSSIQSEQRKQEPAAHATNLQIWQKRDREMRRKIVHRRRTALRYPVTRKLR